MNFKKYHVSRNLINSDKLELGYLNTLGNVSAQDSTYLELTSDFIPVTETNYSWSLSEGWGNRSGWVARCFYNESKGMIDTRLGGRTSGTSGSFQIPSGTAYIKISWRSYGTISLMLNTGSQPLPYEPYSSEVWHDTPHYIHNTSTDTIATLPAVIYANDTTATVGLKGNMVQSSQPSPQTPIQPQECGERTRNLVEVLNSNCIIYSAYNHFTITNDVINITGDSLFGFIVKCSPNTQYTISSKRTGYNCDMRIREYSQKPSDWLTDFITQSVNVGSNVESIPFVTNSATKYLLVCFYGSKIARISDIMLNSGSTALPYENFGYKIPISSAGQTTNVYLGEVQTTRKIKKLVLTGEEDNWGEYARADSSKVPFLPLSDFKGASTTTAYARIICTHYDTKTQVNIQNLTSKTGIAGRTSIGIIIADESISTLVYFKSYLAAQYAAGTPVTIWYVLADPTTGIVNEPLRKIGDYADEVSGITIPTIAGANTISVDTTLQPSEVSANYKGWHPVADVHEADNGAWT